MVLLYEILINIAAVALILFGSNYTILKQFASSKVPSFVIVMIVIMIGLSVSGGLLSLWSSMDNCDRIGHLNNAYYGGRLGIAAVLTYVVVYYFDFLRKPFTTIGGDTIFANTIAIIFYIAMTTSPIILLNHYDSIKANCKLSMSEIEEKVRVLDKELDKRPSETESTKVVVKN